jgi:hypothetical protein
MGSSPVFIKRKVQKKVVVVVVSNVLDCVPSLRKADFCTEIELELVGYGHRCLFHHVSTSYQNEI